MSVLCTFLGILIVEPMLAMMSTPPDVMGEARTYLTCLLYTSRCV